MSLKSLFKGEKQSPALRRLVCILIAVFVITAAGFALRWYAYTFQPKFLVDLKASIDSRVNNLRLPKRPDLKVGLDVTGADVYVDGVLTSEEPRSIGAHDVKLLLHTAEGSRFCDYATGFALDLPGAMKADVSKSPKFVEFTCETAKVTVSRERVYGDDISEYTGYYFNRFLLDEDYRAKNDITLLANEVSDEYELLSIRLNNSMGAFDTYQYIIIKTGTDLFYRIFVRYQSDDSDIANWAARLTEGFRYFRREGKAVYSLDCAPVLPPNWNEETKSLYDRISGSDSVTWGIFTEHVQEAGIDSLIPALEQKLDYNFGVILTYVHQNWDFPTEFLRRCYDENRVVELTYQMTRNNNENVYDRSPSLDLLRYGNGEKIREFARDAKKFGHPFLFRLNNEMNSDWTSYSGVVNLQDPDIYVKNWRTIYRIFQEEGVQNAIWVFNPNDDDYPPANWNSFAAYYPGNEYTQIIGVTGYNTGTYYYRETGEHWREFDYIYDGIVDEFSGLFDRFPWMITEFSSSSIGGDKAKWIRDMFKNIENYPNIKIAVWFSHADYDPAFDNVISRPYRLDETDETLEAFRDGLGRNGVKASKSPL